jgi:hypothetical protein
MRPAPAVATRFLELLCSSAEHESVIGDLFEEYHRGRGRLWYWRQVLVIVFLGLYGRTARRPLVQKARPSLRLGFALPFVVVAFMAACVWVPEAVGMAVFLFVPWAMFGVGMVSCCYRRQSAVFQTLGLQQRRGRVPVPLKRFSYLNLSN